MQIRTLIGLIGLAVIAGACGPGNVFERGIDIRGEITTILPATGGETRGFVRIEGKKQEDTRYDKADVEVRSDTRVYRRSGDVRNPIPFDSLARGQRVEARFNGPVMESYPVRAVASEIVILGE